MADYAEEPEMYRGIPVPPDAIEDWNGEAWWVAGVDAAIRARGQTADEKYGPCIARYGPVLCLERRGKAEFHWHSRFHGHADPDDPLMHREAPCS